MCFTVQPQRLVQQQIIAAQTIQNLLADGSLSAAFGDAGPEHTHVVITAFDRLQECTAALANEQKQVSPFLRYRQEILGHYETAQRLRALVLNLWGGKPANLSLLFMNADERHTRIALELIASYSHYGENDSHFMGLAAEIIETLEESDEVAA